MGVLSPAGAARRGVAAAVVAGQRGCRLWFAGLAPLGAAAGAVLGLLENSWERSQAGPVSCPTSHCDMSVLFAAGVDSTSILGMLIAINSLLALLVAVALGVLTLVVELLLAGGRTTRRLRTSGTGLGGRGQRPGSA